MDGSSGMADEDRTMAQDGRTGTEPFDGRTSAEAAIIRLAGNARGTGLLLAAELLDAVRDALAAKGRSQGAES
ncbi:hypothetical protein [Roseomonas harenae]|jgi:hypothetical protein|uniref:hypothetical protein n=1 Tax=Muricoccus harenae TaxID=2692566 RepID=UPI0013315C03|nr:hypothetical protein [Roseomonas harenae]